MTADSLHHRRPVRTALVLLILIAGYPSAILAVPNSECMDCHEAEFQVRRKDLLRPHHEDRDAAGAAQVV